MPDSLKTQSPLDHSKPHNENKPGKLFLIPTNLGDGPLLEVLPLSVKKKVEELTYYIAENEKTARHFIKKLVPSKPQSSLKFEILNKFTPDTDLSTFLKPCENGIDVGLLSEAGCPGIADPGAAVIQIAHDRNIRVVPLVGPSSISMAMMASGLNGQNFTFHGYLPIDKSDRKKAIKAIEKISSDKNQAQIFIETPYRNQSLFDELKKVLNPGTKLCVAREITTASEFILTKTIAEWKSIQVDLNKRPTVFVLQKERQ